jgi:acetolactate synthase I/II/III large subunit
MKTTDLLAEILKKNNLRSAFGLQGGAVVHIFDSFIKKKIDITFTHHEQSAALAAVSYAKSVNGIGCAIVTTGPGTTNAITGLLSAWQDSIPVIFISGQARSIHTSYKKKVRQVGTQETNICDIVRPITKYSTFIDNTKNFQHEVEKAIKIAISGRPGPVWIDIALDIQWQNLKNIKSVKKIFPEKKTFYQNHQINKSIDLINKSKNPLFVFGYGVILSGINNKAIKKLIKDKHIPCTLTWNTADLLETSNKFNLGIIGMSGQRGANKAIFNSDLLVCLGNHLSIPHTTTLYENFATNAKKIIINIDNNQLKNLNTKFDLKINMDCKKYLQKITKKIFKKRNNDLLKFKKFNWYNPVEKKLPNSNSFIRKLTSQVKGVKSIVIDGGGTALYAGFQSSIIDEKTKIICSSAISSMGTGLAETIGSYKSKKFKKHICIIGDGSFLMNCQDLQTIYQENINVIIVVVNNNGYLAIRHTQKEFLDRRYYGTHPKSGISFPDFSKLANAFKIKYKKIDTLKKSKEIIKKSNKLTGPIILELIVDEDQPALFKQGYKRNNDGTFSPSNLSEMYPFINNPIANTNN